MLSEVKHELETRLDRAQEGLGALEAAAGTSAGANRAIAVAGQMDGLAREYDDLSRRYEARGNADEAARMQMRAAHAYYIGLTLRGAAEQYLTSEATPSDPDPSERLSTEAAERQAYGFGEPQPWSRAYQAADLLATMESPYVNDVYMAYSAVSQAAYAAALLGADLPTVDRLYQLSDALLAEDLGSATLLELRDLNRVQLGGWVEVRKPREQRDWEALEEHCAVVQNLDLETSRFPENLVVARERCVSWLALRDVL